MKMIFHKKWPVFFFITINFFVSVLSSCSQSMYGIQHSYGFSKEVFPGNIPVGENGKPLKRGADTLNIIYLETKNNSLPVWSAIWKNEKLYSYIVSSVNDDSIEIGKAKKDKKPVIIKPQKGDYLWLLQLSQKEITTEKKPVDNNENKFILIGEYNHKKVRVTIDDQIELLPDLSE